MTIKRRKPLARSSKPLKRTELKRGTVRLKRTVFRAGKPKITREWQQARRFVEGRANGKCEANTPACPPGAHRGEHAHLERSVSEESRSGRIPIRRCRRDVFDQEWFPNTFVGMDQLVVLGAQLNAVGDFIDPTLRPIADPVQVQSFGRASANQAVVAVAARNLRPHFGLIDVLSYPLSMLIPTVAWPAVVDYTHPLRGLVATPSTLTPPRAEDFLARANTARLAIDLLGTLLASEQSSSLLAGDWTADLGQTVATWRTADHAVTGACDVITAAPEQRSTILASHCCHWPRLEPLKRFDASLRAEGFTDMVALERFSALSAYAPSYWDLRSAPLSALIAICPRASRCSKASERRFARATSQRGTDDE